MGIIPEAYAGREQTFLKHLVLRRYLEQWGFKLGSTAKARTRKIWFVDCFSGPWKAAREDLEDTSIHIGLSTLDLVAQTWKQKGYRVEPGAVFVEKNPRSFAELNKAVAPWRDTGKIDVRTIAGAFEDCVDDIEAAIGRDAAFLFIDPTGWNGAAMETIARLARHRHRDVLVNLMYSHIRRWQNDPRGFLRAQLSSFFGLGEDRLPPDLSEPELLQLYRDQLKQLCRFRHAADLRIPNPIKNETQFRLVVGGHHPKVLEVFRDAEARVLGEVAPVIRAEAREAQQAHRDLFGPQLSPSDLRYRQRSEADRQKLREEIPLILARGARRYGSLWPELLERHQITRTSLSQLLGELKRSGIIAIPDMGPRERVPKDSHMLHVPMR